MENTEVISKKELFERLIRLEEKLDGITTSNKMTARQFRHFVYLIVTVEIVNLVFTYLLYRK